jgi:Growth-Arrest-Specific Protein 2 Domain
MFWHRADEIYVETVKDQVSALNLLEEVETASLFHPTSRQSSLYTARVDTILKRLAVRGDPASPASLFPRPDHPLFRDQRTSNETLMQYLTLEIGKASQLAEKVDKATRKYRTSYEAVKQVEILLRDVQEVSITLSSIINKFKEGVSSNDRDGVPPDLMSEECLDPTRHSMFLALFPSLFEETTRAIKDADELIKASPVALFGLDLPGIDHLFKENAASDVQRLTILRAEVLSARDSVSKRVDRLRKARKINSNIDFNLASIRNIRAQISEGMEAHRWRQESGGSGAPPTPESSTFELAAPDSSYPEFEDQLSVASFRVIADVKDPLSALSLTLEPALQACLKQKVYTLAVSLESSQQLLQLFVAVKDQSSTMAIIRDTFNALLMRIEDSKVHIHETIDEISSKRSDNEGQTGLEMDEDIQAIQQEVKTFVDSLSKRVPFIGRSLLSPNRTLKPPWSPSDLPQQATIDPPFDLWSVDASVRADSNSFAMRLNGALENLLQTRDHLELARKAKKVDDILSRTFNDISSVNLRLVSQMSSFVHISPHAMDSASRYQVIMDELHSVLSSKRPEIARSFSPTRELLRQMDEKSHKLELSIRQNLYVSRIMAIDDAELRLKTWDEEFLEFKQEVSIALEAELRHQEEIRVIEVQRRKAEAKRIAAEELERQRQEQERIENEENQRLIEERLAEEHRQQLELERIAAELELKTRLEQEAKQAKEKRLAEQEQLAKAARALAEKERMEKDEADRIRLEQERTDMLAKLQAAQALLKEERRLFAESERIASETAEKQKLEMKELERRQIEMQRVSEDRERQAELEKQAELQRQAELEQASKKNFQEADSGKSDSPSRCLTLIIGTPDVFGTQRSPSDSREPQSQELLDFAARISALRKRLRSICINEVVRSTKASASLPSQEKAQQMTQEFQLLSFEVQKLPPLVDDTRFSNELRLLRTEMEESSSLLEEVEKLTILAGAVQSCDAALSDLLEHIDSYPAVPLGVLSSTHKSKPAAQPEEQLSTRLVFTKAVVNDMKIKFAPVANEPRSISESSRILQTWGELEEMANDRIGGKKSRPGSVISTRGSSGRDTRASNINPSNPTNPTKSAHRSAPKNGSYTHLSASSLFIPSRVKLAPPHPVHPATRRSVSGSNEPQNRSTSRLSTTSSSRSVSGPLSTSIWGSTFASRQRTASLSSSNPTPPRQPSLAPPFRLTAENKRSNPPSMLENVSNSRSSMNLSRISMNSTSTWSRAPRDSSILPRAMTPQKKVIPPVRKKYIADPKSKLDVAVGDVVNQLPVGINIESVAEGWRDQSGKYWIGNQEPKLCFCRILRSQTVMVRVGGGWTELSKLVHMNIPFSEGFRTQIRVTDLSKTILLKASKSRCRNLLLVTEAKNKDG